MRKLRALALTCAFTLVLTYAFTLSASPTFRRDVCSCGAPDGSCSVSVSCNGGCTSHCAIEGDCSAQCSGFYGFLEREVTLQMQNSNYTQLLAELADISGKELAFSSPKQNTEFNSDFKRAELWDVLEILSDRGKVQIAGQDFEKLRGLRRKLLSGEKISVCVQNTPVNTYISDLANLTGRPLRITAGSTKATVNLKLRGVTLDDILVSVSEQTGTTITNEDAVFGAQ